MEPQKCRPLASICLTELCYPSVILLSQHCTKEMDANLVLNQGLPSYGM